VALEVLARGGVLLHPTETVYGFGCDAASEEACDRIRRLKGWPAGRPLLSLVRDRAGAEQLAVVTPAAAALIERFWPGPLTLVLRGREGETVAVRQSPHPLAAALVEGLGRPLASSSANRTGEPPPLRASQASWLGATGPDLVLDGGPCRGALGSTIVRCTGDGAELLREGDLPLDAVREVVTLHG